MKLPIYINAQYNEWEKKYEFHAWGVDVSGQPHTGVLVGTTEIDFEPPPHEVLVNGSIAQFREMQKRILADSEKKRAELEQKINELLCLEYKPETEEL